RAPPARRIASKARSYVCFGPVKPAGNARDRFGVRRDIEPNKQGGRARLSQALLAVNKRRSEPCSRCAARAALVLMITVPLAPITQRPEHHSCSHKKGPSKRPEYPCYG
ncbi:hypothetical protein, partial [Pseudomonas sp. KCJK9044]|uniref:hypothetical protein n=1 Tax=Pseudomonas sp. KCJK9044 TaxID=3344562 RepID=UPI003905C8F8